MLYDRWIVVVKARQENQSEVRGVTTVYVSNSEYR